MNTPPVTLVTGASGGIGREIARIAARQGHDLVLVARRETELQELADELAAQHGTTSHVYAMDLLEAGAADRVWARLEEDGIELDVLVNNAGIGMLGSFVEQGSESLTRMVHLNVLVLMQLSHHAARAMRERGHGRILNVGSVSSFQAGPGFAVYHATKAFVLSFSDGIGQELRGSGVTVTTCCPGVTRTDFIEEVGAQRTPLLERLLADPAAVAEAAWSATMAGRTLVVPGALFKIAAHSSRMLPRTLVNRVSGMTLSRGR